IKRKAHVKQSFSLDFLERGTFTEYPFLTISPLSAVQTMTLTGVISFFRGMLDSLFLYLNHSRFIYPSVD
ncbi:hypothetical protein, partial [Bacteroides xylanisolvens]|uniref:hypothetical protein n=1 Tax=Bacteroides xylanisolvens TaxID=371601 RepID=UPI001CDC1AE6